MSEKPSPGPGQKPAPAPKPSLDPAKESAWQKAVEEVRSALAQHDLASAKEALQIAAANAQTSEQHQEVERLRMLRHYLEEFWNGIRQAVSRLEAAQEIVVGNMRVAIVEGNSQYLIVRAEGRNIRWPIERIPGSVVELLAKRWFRTNDTATQLAWGAYYAVRGQTQQARQAWEQAAKSGASDANALLEELRHWPLPEPKSPGGQSPLQ
jgi:transcriptional regulator with PAS, ATPase and Fis domain